MRRTMLAFALALLSALVFGQIARATTVTGSATLPSVIGPDGGSVFTYQDLTDADDKYSGGYVAFDSLGLQAAGWFWDGTKMVLATPDGGTYDMNPHGGYSATSNKCGVCHALHQAEGAYTLLRADSEADACDYCHIGGSAHSSLIVYDLNPAQTATRNGHTIGAGIVPDSTTSQRSEQVIINGTDIHGTTVSEAVNIRSYDEATIKLYRLSLHHAQDAPDRAMVVGPESLTCLSCHHPHAAPTQLWQPTDSTDGQSRTQGYKLLRRSPSGSWVHGQDVAGYSAADNANGTVVQDGTEFVMNDRMVKVPETTLTAGFNFSQVRSSEKPYLENGVLMAQPVWIAQSFASDPTMVRASDSPVAVNELTLSVWCADCHNLNVGGVVDLTQEELGFKAHSERTHPAPFIGAVGGGPGQCYSCHRDDLSVASGKADPEGYGMQQASNGGAISCSQCHYGTADYALDHANRQSDFPHSGSDSNVKLLGNYTASTSGPNSYQPAFTAVDVNEDNLDAVCVRCHPGIGVNQ